MPMRRVAPLAAALGTAVLAACTGGHRVSGDIEGTQNTTVYLESQTSYGNWMPLDSATVTGSFTFTLPEVTVPDIYRLRVGDSYIYFPVDGSGDITVSAAMGDIDTGYTLGGTALAGEMNRANAAILDIARSRGTARADSLKRVLYQDIIMPDTLGLISYYIVTKRVDGRPVFDPEVRRDNGIIGAVAQSFVTRRPDDPRTRMLSDYYMAHMQRHGVTAEAQTVALPEVSLLDENGERRSLTQAAADNRAVILNFTTYAAEKSGDFNLSLRKLYDRWHDSGLEIYQIDVLSSRPVWRHTAINLPWITVYNEDGAAGDKVLTDYQILNADALPAIFVISEGGEQMRRVTDVRDLGGILAGIMQ